MSAPKIKKTSPEANLPFSEDEKQAALAMMEHYRERIVQMFSEDAVDVNIALSATHLAAVHMVHEAGGTRSQYLSGSRAAWDNTEEMYKNGKH